LKAKLYKKNYPLKLLGAYTNSKELKIKLIDNNMHEISINSTEELEVFIKSNPVCVVYFSTPGCNVCKVLKPKLKELLAEDFPKVKFGYVDLNSSREIVGQLTIFTAPTIIFFVEGSEALRESRNINFQQMYDRLSRVYNMIYE
jgi:thioredoxin-like negative regulator of GroEL